MTNLAAVELVNMHEAKTHLSRLVARVLAGEEIVIGRDGTPVAKLVPYTEERSTPRPFGLLKGKVWISNDFYEHDELANEIEERLTRPIDP